MAASPDFAACPVTSAVQIVGGKWKIPLLWHLQRGPMRFSALRRAVPGISEKMLGQQLHALTADGLVLREAYAEVPPRVEYTLTASGEALVPVLNALADWSLAHTSAEPAAAS
ncbi:MAG: helix-turn-helix domain-containing protein [Bacteroidota bacterium]